MGLREYSKWCLTIGVIVILTGLTVACGADEQTDGRIGVVVTIPPQKEFVERIGGDRVDVTVMVSSADNLHTYEPTPRQMTAVSHAGMYVKVGSGVEFELVWMGKIIEQSGDISVLDCAEGVDLIEMAAEHDYESGDNRQHGALDPHIWMSPLNAEIMVKNICDGLIKIDPEGRSLYENNGDLYLGELTSLHDEISDALAAVEQRIFMVYHPSFGYFAAEYDLIMLPVEEEGKEPTAAGLERLIEQAKKNDIEVIFASPQFKREFVDVIANEIDGTVVLIDPLAEDYIENVRMLLTELVKVMK